MDGNSDMDEMGGMTHDEAYSESESPSLIQYRSKRRCVMEREKKKKKEWWEEENMLSDEEDREDGDSDGSDNPRKKRKKPVLVQMPLLPPPPNRIYVFSTELANRAAEAVVQGRVPSIVAYHRAQPQNQQSNMLRNTPAEFAMSQGMTGGNVNPYRGYPGNYPGHMPPKMPEGMFHGGKPVSEMLSENQGRGGGGGMPLAGMPGGGFTSMHQYQQYLKQQHEQQTRTAMPPGVDELQQMLFGAPNGGVGPRGMLPPSADGQGMPPGPAYSFPPGFRPPMDSGQLGERFRFPQPQQQQSYPANTQTQQLQAGQLAQPSQQQQQQQSFSPSPTVSTGNTAGQQPHLPPVLSPSSSASSSSPLSNTIRSPPPYPNPRASAEANTLPGASTVVGAPSPTSVGSPQTPHGPLTPRLATSLASPKDSQRPPFSPSGPTGGPPPPTSAGYTTQTSQQQNIRDTGAPPSMKQQHLLARHSPSLENPSADLPGAEKGSGIPQGYPPSMMSDAQVNFSNSRPQEAGGGGGSPAAFRPNSLDLPREEPQSLPPPNRSPFLPGTSPMAAHHHNQMSGGTTSGPSPHPSPHYSSKSFSVESLTAPPDHKPRGYYRPPMQAPSPYAAYPQQPGLFYPGQKFPPGMLAQGQYQFPPHMQPPPQQFFPGNLPPNMYLPRSSFPIHHAGNREGGM